jgi:glycosyltransferase involved in cell wall biosynthesis
MNEASARPRLSIVIPNYSHAHTISEAIAAIRQTVLPFEVVVVDDGSTDDSIARVQALAVDRPWLRIHRCGENRGVSDACDTGLGIVSGDFVLFSAADDCLSPEVVESASAAAATFPQTGIVFSDQAEMSVDGASKRVMRLDLPQTRRYFSVDDFVRLMQRHFSFFRFRASGSMSACCAASAVFTRM